MPKLKISQVMLSQGFGGLERLFVDLCQALASRGHLVQAICHPFFHGKSLLTHQSIKVASLKASLDWSPWSRYLITKHFKSFAPQVVHVHSARSATVAGDAASHLKIPVVANIHDYVKLKYYRRASHFCPGTSDLQHYLTGLGVNQEQITVIPHFTSIDAIKAPPGDGQRHPILLAYGRLDYVKGFDVLIESIARLKKQGITVKLLLGGDGPERKKLQDLIVNLNLADQIEMVGWVEDVVTFLDQGSFFVLPSRQESFGIAVLEAMARGKTIIATKTPGPSEILDSSSAYLAEVEDPESLCQELSKALLGRKESLKKAENAWSKYQQNYTTEQITARFVEIYRKILANQPINS